MNYDLVIDSGKTMLSIVRPAGGDNVSVSWACGGRAEVLHLDDSGCDPGEGRGQVTTMIVVGYVYDIRRFEMM